MSWQEERRLDSAEQRPCSDGSLAVAANTNTNTNTNTNKITGIQYALAGAMRARQR